MERLEKYYKVAATIVIAAFVVGAALTLKPRNLGIKLGNREFIIESGQSLGATARKLAERDFVVNRLLFVFYSVLTGHERNFKAGRYVLPEHASIRDLVRIFSEGRVEPDDIVVTIPEGTNVADIDRILVEAGLIQKEEFLKAAINSEGFLFPDTYHFRNQNAKIPRPYTDGGVDKTEEVQPQEFQEVEPLNHQIKEIIQKMKNNFDIKTRDSFYSPEIEGIVEDVDRGPTIIIASMLEKEVQTEEDMRLVAGIIEKRLELGMPLQIDATVAYGACYSEFIAGRYCDVSLADIVDNLKIDSEYNTYVRKALPVRPISNPGLKAIRAALNPQNSEYLYYLSAKDGVTIFSKTAVEHERNRAKYLRN